MADKLDALLARVDDASLRAELASQIDVLRRRRQFGLVFEEHLPESVRLPQHRIRRGSKVVRRDQPDNTPAVVTRVAGGEADVLGDNGAETTRLDELVAVAEFGEPIYPGLRRLGSVDRGGDKPSHVVIKGENHHALEALQFTHAGKIDCIYIDPPYNTGARDWKYNNDYVESDDAYRHSKWLAMMQRRLLLARQLLNPHDSVLIVTIDEKEVHRLALLVNQVFPQETLQLVSIVINPLGQARARELARVEEFALVVFLGVAAPFSVVDDLLSDRAPASKVRWEWLLRGGTNSSRSDRPNLFYPVFIDPETRSVVEVGEPLSAEADRTTVADRPGLRTVWPLRTNGDEGNWRTSAEYLRDLLAAGYARVGAHDARNDRWSLLYLGKAQIRRIEEGELVVTGHRHGAVVLEYASAPTTTAKTVWNRSSHRAGEHGTKMLKRLVPGSGFPFPKSLFAVEDALRIAVGGKPDAVVLDFFAGSGTTAHAVARLNRQDGGSRQSISITNNEVSAEEAKRLAADGSQPGDAEWEALGIFEHVTRPRIEAAFTGVTPDGDPVEGDYKFTDEFPMAEGFEENVEFVELTYLDAEAVELDRAFEAIAPLLWMRAGSVGPILTECLDSAGRRKPYAISEHYGVLFNPDRWRSFVEKLAGSVTHVFVVTDSASEFAAVASELPAGVEPVRLYENYLSTFAVNMGGMA